MFNSFYLQTKRPFSVGDPLLLIMVICSTHFTFYGPYIIDDGHLSPVLQAEIISTFEVRMKKRCRVFLLAFHSRPPFLDRLSWPNQLVAVLNFLMFYL